MSPRLPALALTLLAALLSGCQRGESITAVLAKVEVSEDNTAACVRLVVRPASGPDQLTGPLERTKNSFRVAVYQSAGLGPTVTLLARGYPNCVTRVANTEGPPVTATFPRSGSTEVVVPLPLSPVPEDADRDGHVDEDAGGDDCNDSDATTFPGADEDCAGDVDRNCNGSSGCLDPSCEGKGCKAGGSCMSLACVGTEREICDDGADNDGNGRADCQDEACEGQACSDGNACTQGETCLSDNGQRRCGGPAAITSCTQPPNPCFQVQGTCDRADGGCSYVLNNPLPACDDGDACTMSDTCLTDGGCGGSPVQCNGPTGSCFAPATCNPDGGFCDFPILVGNACDDGLLCTVGDRCLEDGACAPTGSVSCDAGTCQLSVCMTANGQCSAPIPANNGGACDDGNGCTLSDTCAGGTCAGINVTCDDTNPCTDDACNPSDGGCVYTKDDTNTCWDGNGCSGPNGVDRCFQGACVAGTEKVCSDSNVCTSDGCDGATGNCVFTALSGTPCSDGDGCTGPGGADTCTSGICVPGLQKSCSDGNPCTDDACIPADGGCSFVPDDGNTCDDQSLCTSGDHCSAGACVTTPVTCDDGNGCTLDGCDTGVGCLFTVSLGATCSDGNGCTVGDACAADAGCEPGTLETCDDGLSCTVDSCDPQDGGCSNVPDDTSCDGGNPCAVDTCNPINGCEVAYKPLGSACSDTNACTTAEQCNGAGTCGSSSVNCDDGNACTVDACNTGSGCANTPLADDTLCTGGACLNGTCLARTFFGTSASELPSNFDPTSALLRPRGPLTVSCTTAAFHTGTLDGTTPPSFTGCAGSTDPAPTVQVITQSGSATPATVLSVTSLSIPLGGVLTVTGERPAILAVFGDATLAGIVDASGDLAVPGPGGGVLTAGNGAATCSSTVGAASSGGAGGAGSGSGGSSGAGSLSSGTSPAGVLGPSLRALSTLRPLVGGQSGGAGGAVDATKPSGGGGGGGLQVSVSGKLLLSGTLTVSGGGGGSGTIRTGTCGGATVTYGSGGGGGGAGGNILLEANRFSLKGSAKLSANGGAGAEGGDTNEVGALGVNGSETSWATTAAAAGLANKGGLGGNGGGANIPSATAGVAANGGGSDYAGGGGGGGAAGYIRLNLLMTTVSNTHLCRETGYVVSPSTAAVTGGLNASFTANVALPASAACN
jgi:hypothetical protein